MKLNIAAYRFESIADVPALADAVRARCEALVLRGSVLVAPEGINLFLAGEEGAVRRFLDWLRRDVRFATIEAKESWSDEVPFARLKVKRKNEIIAFRRDHASPLQSGERAPAVDPATLARWIDNTPSRDRILEQLGSLPALLGGGGATGRAAKIIADMVREA